MLNVWINVCSVLFFSSIYLAYSMAVFAFICFYISNKKTFRPNNKTSWNTTGLMLHVVFCSLSDFNIKSTISPVSLQLRVKEQHSVLLVCKSISNYLNGQFWSTIIGLIGACSNWYKSESRNWESRKASFTNTVL